MNEWSRFEWTYLNGSQENRKEKLSIFESWMRRKFASQTALFGSKYQLTDKQTMTLEIEIVEKKLNYK